MTGIVLSLLLSIVLAAGCASTPPPAPAATGQLGTKNESSPAPATVYACPMDPEVVSSAPGNCPKCGMKLRPRRP